MGVHVIASLSGGRDSTAMVLKSLELGERIDYILCNDTLSEFPLMYEYLQKVNTYIQKKYGKSIIFTKPMNPFEYWVFGKVTRGDNKGKIRGLPKKIDPCFWKRESKVYPAERFYKAMGLDPKTGDFIKLIGYTKTEEAREEYDDTPAKECVCAI